MTDFAQTMHDWRRMCKYFENHYDCNCCNYCPLKNCGAIWEMDDATDWEKIEKSIDIWAAENPELKYPTWREFIYNYCNSCGYDGISVFMDRQIPAEIAKKLELQPK